MLKEGRACLPADIVNPTPPRRTPGTLGHIMIFGVPVRFHFTFLFLIALVAAASLQGGGSWAMDALFLIALFASVLIHELAHALVSRRYGIATTEIILYPIGGVARMERRAGPRAEFWTALAGPAINLAIGALFIAAAGPAGQVPRELLRRIGEANLYLGGFNLLPAFPLDGARVLRAMLAASRGDQSATLLVARLGRLLAILLGLYAIWASQMLLLMVAFLLYLAGYQESAGASGRAFTEGVPVRVAMITDFRTVSHGSTLRDAANLVLASSQQDFPVVHGDEVVGLLDRNGFVRGLATEGPEVYVSHVMERNFVRLAPDTDLAQSIDQLAESGSCALVMDQDALVGMLTRENVAEYLLLRRLGVESSRV
jgi:Zn-dependent protease